MSRKVSPSTLLPAAAPAASDDGRFARIIELSADAIISVDAAQRIVMFNAGATNTFGYAVDEIIGQHLDVLIPPRFRAGHRMKVSNFSGGAPMARHMGQRQTIFALRKGGEEFPAEATISKIMLGDGHVLTVVLRDVSERYRIEEQRRIDAERLRYALHAGQLGSYVHDLATGDVTLIGMAPDILGIDRTSLTIPEWSALVHAEDRAAFRHFIARAARHQTSVKLEHRLAREDGSLRWVQVSAEPGDHNGDLNRRFGIVQDITVQKTEQQVLEARVAERTAALEREIRQREEVQRSLMRAQRMEVYGQLTGGVAHDFNNLLTIIGGNLELLDDHVGEERPRRLLKRAMDAVAMGSRLTGRLLTFARRSRLEPEVLDLNEQVLGVIDLLRRTIGEMITISAALAPDLGRVRADPSEVENAILNLAINARDAMPDGGSLMIETADVIVGADAPAPVSIDTIPPGAYVRLSVSDTGTGMTPEVLARAFEPFFTTKEHGKGTGLGLATIYGFVRQSNGYAAIESRPGHGTTVSLFLPRTLESCDADEPHGQSVGVALSRRTILVVEDNPDVRDVTTARLERLGYDVIACGDGPSALAELKRNAGIDLVFSDIMMAGGMSGHDIAAWLFQNMPEMKVLLTSGVADGAVAAAKGNGPAPKVLQKPYGAADLAREIAAALDGDQSASTRLAKT